MIRRNHPAPSAGTPTPGFSQSVELLEPRRIVFVAGQVPALPDGLVPATFDDQAEAVWGRVAHELEQAGMQFRNLVKVTIFLADRKYSEENRAVRKRILGHANPALSVVVASLLDPRWFLEIEAIACD